jgi:hypothetical protein
MFDTEPGSDFLIPDFEEAGIPFMVEKAVTLKALIETVDDAEKNGSVLIIDSITHPYRELIAAYLKQKNRTFLQIDDWNYIKGDYGWAQFTKRYINSKLHIIMCGRAGDDLEQYTDENGKRQLEKIGTKMKTEAETGFEPSLLVLMEQIERNEREPTGRIRTVVRRATVMKDRWDKIDGQQFEEPRFQDFLPHISRLALGGEHVGVNDRGDSRSILLTEKRDWQPVQRKIALGEIQDLLVLKYPSTSGADRQAKITALKEHFNASWVEIEETMPLPDLRAGYDKLHRALEGTPSKYAAPEAEKVELNDGLPDHSAPPVDPKPGASIEELLRKQLAELNSTSEVAHFMMAVGKRDDLDARARLRLSDAMTARLGEIGAAKAPAEEQKPDKPKKERKGAAAKADEPEEPIKANADAPSEPVAQHAANGSAIAMFA